MRWRWAGPGPAPRPKREGASGRLRGGVRPRPAEEADPGRWWAVLRTRDESGDRRADEALGALAGGAVGGQAAADACQALRRGRRAALRRGGCQAGRGGYGRVADGRDHETGGLTTPALGEGPGSGDGSAGRRRSRGHTHKAGGEAQKGHWALPKRESAERVRMARGRARVTERGGQRKAFARRAVTVGSHRPAEAAGLLARGGSGGNLVAGRRRRGARRVGRHPGTVWAAEGRRRDPPRW